MEGCGVLRLSGDLDIFNREQTQQQLQELLAHRYAIIDLRKVRTIDATFLGQLAALRRINAGNDGAIALVVSSPAIQKVLRLVRFDETFTLAPSVAEAHRRIQLSPT